MRTDGGETTANWILTNVLTCAARTTDLVLTWTEGFTVIVQRVGKDQPVRLTPTNANNPRVAMADSVSTWRGDIYVTVRVSGKAKHVPWTWMSA